VGALERHAFIEAVIAASDRLASTATVPETSMVILARTGEEGEIPGSNRHVPRLGWPPGRPATVVLDHGDTLGRAFCAFFEKKNQKTLAHFAELTRQNQ